MDATGKSANPWYREPWPWIVMAIPGTSVVLGILLVTIAAMNQDGLVAEDYYKRGLAVNMVLERERRAAELDMNAQVLFGDSRVRVFLRGEGVDTPVLRMHLVHPTLADKDVSVTLTPMARGWYEAALSRPAAMRWQVLLEDAGGTWRLAGRLDASRSGLQLVADEI